MEWHSFRDKHGMFMQKIKMMGQRFSYFAVGLCIHVWSALCVVPAYADDNAPNAQQNHAKMSLIKRRHALLSTLKNLSSLLMHRRNGKKAKNTT